MGSMGLEVRDSEEARQWCNLVFQVPDMELVDTLDYPTVRAIAGLWEDPGVQACVARSQEFQVRYKKSTLLLIISPDAIS